MATFSSYDYAVLAVTLISSSLIGVVYGFLEKKHKTTRNYLLADRSMKVIPVAFSVTASYISAISLMGTPSEIYQFGSIILYAMLALVLATPTIAYGILPVFMNMGATSIYEYLELRFGVLLRVTVSLIFTFQQILFMAIAMYAPALALETVTGINRFLAISVIGLVCTFYSTIGGIKAVIATDILQGILMVFPLLGAFIYATIETERANQVQVQRFSTVEGLRQSQKCVWWNLLFMTVLQGLIFLGSIAIFWYYHNCDPLLEGRITSRDQLLPLFIMDTMSHIPGLPGLMMSAIFCGALSSVSSVINSMSAIVLEDYLKPLNKVCCKVELTARLTLLTTKAISLTLGIIFTASAFLGDCLGGLLEAALTTSGVVAGPILGVFLLGMLTMNANHIGTLFGLVIGLCFASFMAFAQPKATLPILELSTESCINFEPQEYFVESEEEYFWFYNVSFMWYSVIGFLATFICGYFLSWILYWCRLQSNEKLYIENKNFNAMLLSPVFVETLVFFGWRKYEGSDEDLYY
uniref:Sodium-dependent multivitamin transporter n=1 Tax=Megaselia scalaris TaxID=36166 RepID=T1GHZ2_MEGSC